MTCSKANFGDFPVGQNVHLVRCTPELAGCGGTAVAVGDCVSATHEEAKALISNGDATLALTASVTPTVQPVFRGTTGVKETALAIVMTLPDASTMTYAVVSDSEGNWDLDTAIAGDDSDPAVVLAGDVFSIDDALTATVKATIGTCGELVKTIESTIA